MLDQMLTQVESTADKYFGKYKGTVVDNNDPEQRGRLKVRVHGPLGTAEAWAEPCVPYAGPSLGFFAMPETETGVWVEFEAGDISHPIWTGCYWNKGDIPAADAKPEIKFFKTNKFTLRIDDSNGEIIIENDSGSQLKLTAQDLLAKSATVNQEASGGRKTVLGASGFNVNNGSLEVL